MSEQYFFRSSVITVSLSPQSPKSPQSIQSLQSHSTVSIVPTVSSVSTVFTVSNISKLSTVFASFTCLSSGQLSSIFLWVSSTFLISKFIFGSCIHRTAKRSKMVFYFFSSDPELRHVPCGILIYARWSFQCKLWKKEKRKKKRGKSVNVDLLRLLLSNIWMPFLFL